MATPNDVTKLCFLPATELAARIRRGDVSPVEVVDAYLVRIEQRNPVVNAPIIGATRDHHLTDAAAALDVKLTSDEVAALEASYVPREPTYF